MVGNCIPSDECSFIFLSVFLHSFLWSLTTAWYFKEEVKIFQGFGWCFLISKVMTPAWFSIKHFLSLVEMLEYHHIEMNKRLKRGGGGWWLGEGWSKGRYNKNNTITSYLITATVNLLLTGSDVKRNVCRVWKNINKCMREKGFIFTNTITQHLYTLIHAT